MRKELEMGSKIMDTSLFAVCFHQPRPYLGLRDSGFLNRNISRAKKDGSGHVSRSCFIIVRDQMAGARGLGDL